MNLLIAILVIFIVFSLLGGHTGIYPVSYGYGGGGLLLLILIVILVLGVR